MNKFIKAIGLVATISICATSVIASDNLEEVKDDKTITISLSDNITEGNDDENILTLERAIEKAISNDDTLAMYQRTLKLHNQQIKGMQDYGSKAYLLKVIEIDELEYSMEKLKDVIEKNVIEQYNNIIMMKKNIELLDSQIKINQDNLKRADLQKSQGYMDQASYDKLVKALDNSINAKNQTLRNLGDLKNSFYQLTLFDVNEYSLQVVCEYTPYELEKDIDVYAKGMAVRMLKYKEQRVKLDENRLWDDFSNGVSFAYDVYIGMQNNVITSRDSLESKYDKYENNIEASYTTLLQQMDTVETKIKELETVKNDDKTLEVRYKHGYISQMDYNAQKVALQSKEIECLKEVNRYNILKIELEKPWTQSWALME